MINCDNCGVLFNKKTAEIKRTSFNFCSKKCTGEFRQKKTVERFYTKAAPNGDCLEWTGALNNQGYGIQKFKGKAQLAHRVAYQISVGDIKNMNVLHRCDNPKCINPAHLFLGSHIDNMRDMIRNGRKWSKLTFDDVVEIRSSSLKNSELSRKYSVSERTIRYAKHSSHWQPLPDPPEEE